MSSTKQFFTARDLEFIQQQRVGRLATSDAQGHPTAVPVCYIFDGEHFMIALDEKPKSVDVFRLKRVRNIEARHEATLLIDRYEDDWSRLAYILIYGKAELVPPQHIWHTTALPLLRTRYVQYQTMALEKLPMIAIIPERVRSWYAG